MIGWRWARDERITGEHPFLASLIGYVFGAAYFVFTYLGASGLWLLALLLIWAI